MAVIDAQAMAGTFAAIAYGLQHYPGPATATPSSPNAQTSALRWAGALANRVGSPGHAAMLEAALPPSDWLGALARDASLALPEQPMGLLPANEMADSLTYLERAADALAPSPLGQMQPADWQRWRVDFAPAHLPPVPPLLAGRTLAIARDAAFCMVDAANVQLLHALGAQLRYFSPLADEAIPDCHALWLPSGYQHLHAPTLQAAQRTRRSLAAHLAQGLPVWAEAGAWLQLFEYQRLPDGSEQALWQLLPGHITRQTRVMGLGPQRWHSPWGELRGHTFHHSQLQTELPVWQHSHHAHRSAAAKSIYQIGSLRGSCLQLWFASNPSATAALFLPEPQTP